MSKSYDIAEQLAIWRECCDLFFQDVAPHPELGPRLVNDVWCRSAIYPPGWSTILCEPMTDDQAVGFGQESMPFGKYRGRRIADIPLGYLQYLDKHVELICRLRSYVESDIIQSEIHEEASRVRSPQTTPHDEFAHGESWE